MVAAPALKTGLKQMLGEHPGWEKLYKTLGGVAVLDGESGHRQAIFTALRNVSDMYAEPGAIVF